MQQGTMFSDCWGNRKQFSDENDYARANQDFHDRKKKRGRDDESFHPQSQFKRAKKCPNAFDQENAMRNAWIATLMMRDVEMESRGATPHALEKRALRNRLQQLLRNN